MNGTVLVFLFLGYAMAFWMYGFDCDRDKTLPVNCCAWSIFVMENPGKVNEFEWSYIGLIDGYIN